MSTDECGRIAGRLASWADDALDAASRAELDRHLEACASCRQAAALENGGRTVLRARAARLRGAPLPPGLQNRCEALLRAHGAPGRLWGWRPAQAALAAGLIFFAATALLALGTPRSPGLLAAQLTADHLKCFHLAGGPDPAAGDSAEIEAVLLERYGWNLRVPPSTEDGEVQLLGARRCLYAEGAVPHLMYRASGQDMSLYMLNGVARDRVDVVTMGYRSRIWSSGEMTYVLVAPDGNRDVAAAVDYVMQRAR